MSHIGNVRARRAGLILAALALLAFGLHATMANRAMAAGSPTATSGLPDRSEYLPAAAPAPGAEVVRLGIEPISFDGISVSDQSFKTSFYIWWRWRGKIDPVPTTDVINSAAADTFYVVNYSYTNAAGKEKPTRLPDGSFYQTARISTGIADPFSVNRYPLDHQDLRIRIENNTYDSSHLVYEPDTANMTRDPEVEVAGWGVTGSSISTRLHRYGTNFGITGGNAAASQYSQVVYDVGIKRPVSHFIVKLFIPLLVIFTAALAALLVMEDKFDVRLVMVGTGLLTLILLQQAYAADLPATAPGVLMDKIYIAAYAGLGLTFLRVIYTANKIHHHEQSRHDYIAMDRRFAGALWVGFVIASALLIAF
ncbi:MAG: hypothetical protein JWM71_1265 [Solirubrobacteraceae bacterium]|nr:hypothetical protein [Solirubrobacteraceae bacterium]